MRDFPDREPDSEFRLPHVVEEFRMRGAVRLAEKCSVRDLGAPVQPEGSCGYLASDARRRAATRVYDRDAGYRVCVCGAVVKQRGLTFHLAQDGHCLARRACVAYARADWVPLNSTSEALEVVQSSGAPVALVPSWMGNLTNALGVQMLYGAVWAPSWVNALLGVLAPSGCAPLRAPLPGARDVVFDVLALGARAPNARRAALAVLRVVDAPEERLGVLRDLVRNPCVTAY